MQLIHIAAARVCHLVPCSRDVHVQDWLAQMGRSESDADAIVAGFRESLGHSSLAFINFSEFARGYQWLLRTLSFMQQAADHGFSMARLPSFKSIQVLPLCFPFPPLSCRLSLPAPTLWLRN